MWRTGSLAETIKSRHQKGTTSRMTTSLQLSKVTPHSNDNSGQARLYTGLLVLSWNLLMVDSNGRASDYLFIIGPIGGAPLKARLDHLNRGAVLMTCVNHSSRQVWESANDALRVPFVDKYISICSCRRRIFRL